MHTHKMLLACLAALIGTSAAAQRDHSSMWDARAQRNFEACVEKNARGQQYSRRALRRLEEQCRRGVAQETPRRALPGTRQRESVDAAQRRESAGVPQRRESATERRTGQVLRNDESNSPGGTLRRKGGD